MASVLDLSSRALIGWSMSDRHDAALACAALEVAVATRGRRRMDGVIMHTDRGLRNTPPPRSRPPARGSARDGR